MASSLSSSPSSTTTSTPLYRKTPLIYSEAMSRLFREDGNHHNKKVYLKLDLIQDSGSFKDRGMARLCQTVHDRGVRRLVCSSGGNAGLAAATAACKLGMTIDVVVPVTTKPMVVEKLSFLGGTNSNDNTNNNVKVTVHGENWNAADTLARAMLAESGSGDPAYYVSPYDDPLLWEGHSTVVDEVVEELSLLTSSSSVVGTFVVSVGGGGLLCGVLDGLTRVGADTTTRVVAAETEGAASFHLAYSSSSVTASKETGMATPSLTSIDTVATSLGALQVTDAAVRKAQSHAGGVVPSVCTDREAVEACLAFARDHRMLVEPACGAALAVIYSDRCRRLLFDKDDDRAVVIEVCGGNGVNLDLLASWKSKFDIKM